MAHENAQEEPSESGVDEGLLELLVCPSCHESVQERGDLLVCTRCAVGYPVRDGIPVMLVAEAVPVEGDEPSGSEGP